MPELTPKFNPHPAKRESRAIIRNACQIAFAELQVTSNFTFLTGASHPDELVVRSAELGYRAIAITDTNTLAGIVRAHVAAKQLGVRFIVGCRLVLADPADLAMLVYPTDVASYGRLCRMLTLGKRRTTKGNCRLSLEDLLDYSAGLVAVAIPPARIDDDYLVHLQTLGKCFDDDRLSIAASCCYSHDDAARLREVASLAQSAGVPMVATQDIYYHLPERQLLQDVLTCIRHGCTLEQAGYRLMSNAERYLKPPEEVARLFAKYPRAVARSVEIVDRCGGFSLDQICSQYPVEVVPEDVTPDEHLAALAWNGAAWRYPAGVSVTVKAQLQHELELIDELKLAHYFLTVHDLVRWSRQQGILCQGRGAAANSAVCFCLGITEVDPDRIDVLFERFVSRSRNEPPDIDIDFEHERREEAIQYLYRKYGRDRAALTAEVITYRGRSAVRDVGKALGLSLDTIDVLAKDIDWWSGQAPDADTSEALGFTRAGVTMRHLLLLTAQIQGFPRHLSQHVGGFVLAQTPLCELVPIENAAMPDRTVIEWDKDDLDALGLIKVDVLGLGMLTCIRKCFELIESNGGPSLSIATLPPEDQVTYDMICRADTVGVFQIESRAQMSMLPRLRPRCFYDLVIEVAIVRPGPIQGDMVHPYLRRRMGEEDVPNQTEAMARILQKTLGVPLFQEQAMQLAIDCAGFTPDEADSLRRAVTGFRRYGDIETFEQKFIGGMTGRGHPHEFAVRCFEQIKGFSSYGFPESHAASFALLVYASCFLKCHYPAAFAAAIINSQPMGFYAPAQIVADARRHGIDVRCIDVHHSSWNCTLEEGEDAIRLGMRRVRGLREDDAERIAAAVRSQGPFESIESLWRASGATARGMRCLAAADAFGSMGLDRQSSLWHARKLRNADAPLFESCELHTADRPVALPTLPKLRHVVQDYNVVGLSLRDHPLRFLRCWLDTQRVSCARDLADERHFPKGRGVAVAGLCLVRQRPGTAKGITFMTIEDETGMANLIVHPRTYDHFRRVARHATAFLARGRVDRNGSVVHVIVASLLSLDDRLERMRSTSRDFR